TLTPSSGAPGSIVAVHGLGFTPGETVDLLWNGDVRTGTLLTSVTAQPDGHLDASVSVPAGTSGAYTLTAYGLTSGESYGATFRVTTLSTVTQAQPGQGITVYGAGFWPNEEITLLW